MVGSIRVVILGIIISAFLLFGCISTDYSADNIPDDLKYPKDVADYDAQAYNATNYYQNYSAGVTPEQPTAAKEIEVEEQTSLHTVKGKSKGKIPYAPVNSEGVVVKTVNHKGGVVSTPLSTGMTVYLVIPEDEIIEGATAKVYLLPYKEMPTGPNHPGLSDELGYGVQIDISSIQMGIRGYLVFDKSGRDWSKVNKQNPYDRCNPKMTWFNPILCAKDNGVPPAKLIDREFAIVTPIHNKNYDSIVQMRSTIPTGINGMIVMQISGDDVYVPQRLDKPLANIFIKNTLKTGNREDKITAAAYAFEWGIPLTLYEAEKVEYALIGDDSYSNTKKVLFVGKKLGEYTGYKSQQASDENEAENWDDLKRKASDDVNDTKETMFGNIETDTKYMDESIGAEAAATVDDLEGEGVDGATEAADKASENVNDQIENPKKGGTPLNAFDSALWMEQNFQNELDNLKKRGCQEARDLVEKPKGSIRNLLHAAELGQMLGCDDEDGITSGAFGKIHDLLNKMLENKGLCRSSLMDIAELGMLMGFDDVSSNAMGRAESASNECDCDALVKKNLANFGMNECK